MVQSQVDSTTYASTRLGMWAAFALFILCIAYVGVIVVGLDFKAADPTPKDPVLAVMQVLTVVAALLIVVMMAAVHGHAGPEHKTHGLIAFGLALLMAGVTCCITFASLTTLGHSHSRGTDLPAMVTSANWFVWDTFLGLSLLFSAPAFRGKGLQRATRVLLRIAGCMCILGTLGPATGRMGLQAIASVGYGMVFPVACLFIGMLWRREVAERT